MESIERAKKIAQIIDQVVDWEIDELIEYVQDIKFSNLSVAPDFLIEWEWNKYVNGGKEDDML